jgi:spore coat protein U-like protein
MKQIIWWVLAAALLAASSIALGQTCSFNGSGGSITFSAFDPSVATTQTAFVDLKVKCNPAGFTPTWQFRGAHGNAPLRMKHSSQNAFIPYSVAPSFLSATGVNQNWRVTATVLGTDYQNGLVGSYSDTLTATVIP